MKRTILKVSTQDLKEVIKNSLYQNNDGFENWGVDVFIEKSGKIWVSNLNAGNQSYPELDSVAWCWVEKQQYNQDEDDLEETVQNNLEYYQGYLEGSLMENDSDLVIDWI